MQWCLPHSQSFGHNSACAVKSDTHIHRRACTLTSIYLTLAGSVTHSRHSVINVLQPVGSFDLSHCVHPPQAPGSPPPFDLLLPAWSMFEREREKKKFSYPVTSLQALSREWGWAHHATWGPAAWCSTPLLFQLSGYSPKPKGVFNGGLGITGLTVNSSKVKGLGRCPKPCMLRTPLA